MKMEGFRCRIENFDSNSQIQIQNQIKKMIFGYPTIHDLRTIFFQRVKYKIRNPWYNLFTRELDIQPIEAWYFEWVTVN